MFYGLLLQKAASQTSGGCKKSEFYPFPGQEHTKTSEKIKLKNQVVLGICNLIFFNAKVQLNASSPFVAL